MTPVSVTTGLQSKDKSTYRITNERQDRHIKIYGQPIETVSISYGTNYGTVYGTSKGRTEPIGTVPNDYEYSHHDKFEVVFKRKVCQ